MQQKYDEWVEFAKSASDSDLLEQLVIISDIEKKQLFSDKSLSFGTAGVRSKVGLGPSLLNIYNVYRLGLAYAQSLSEENKERGVIIFHDTRDNSSTFSEILVSAIKASGINKIFIAKENNAMITPIISFIIRNNQLGGGIMVTASHNPPDYQGMKFYDQKGIQISDHLASVIEEKYLQLPLTQIQKVDLDNEVIQEVSDEAFDCYFGVLKSQYRERQQFKKRAKILLTTLQGASTPFVERLIKDLKLNIDFVESEKKADPLFKVAHSTNPEKFDKAYNNALSVAFNEDYDVLLAIDPDGDRLGVVDVREMKEWLQTETQELNNLSVSDIVGDDKPWCLSGNKVSVLLLDQVIYELKRKLRKKNNVDNEKRFIVRSHVTSNAVDVIAKEHDIDVISTFTGFKWIGNSVDSEISQGKKLLMAFEESIGYFFSDKLREKDSLQALLCIIKLIERLKDKDEQLSVTSHLSSLFERYGYFFDKTDNIQVKITKPEFVELVNEIRISQLMSEGNVSVEEILDPTTNELSILKLHFSNDEGWIAIRPSGTEPKVKVYYVLKGQNNDLATIHNRYNKTKDLLSKTINDFIAKKS